MPVDDERVIWDAIGEPPESPWGYAARNGISESEVPQEVFKAWRTWNTKEQEFVEKAAQHASGQSTDEILQSLGYKDEADKGKSMFARYRSGEKAGVLENIAQDAWGRTIQAGHATWDPTRNAYINPGTGTWENPSQIWDKQGRVISGAGYKGTGVTRPINSAILRGTGVTGRANSAQLNLTGTAGTLSGNTGVPGMGGSPGSNLAGATASLNAAVANRNGPQRGDAGYRPNLRTDPNNYNYGGWGSSFGRPMRTGSAARKNNLTGATGTLTDRANGYNQGMGGY